MIIITHRPRKLAAAKSLIPCGKHDNLSTEGNNMNAVITIHLYELIIIIKLTDHVVEPILYRYFLV